MSGAGDFRKTIVLPLAQAIAHSPALSYLNVDGQGIWGDFTIPSLHDIFGDTVRERGLPLRHLSLMSLDAYLDKVSLVHFKSLTSITFFKCRDYRQTTDGRLLWKAFLAEGIRLEELTVDDISSELVDFIASFSGLQRLALHDLGSTKASDNIADMFFRHALPMHRCTLHSLTLGAAYQGKWCFSEVNTAAILDCQKLNCLSIALQWEDYDAQNKQQSPVVSQLFHVTYPY
jgi:hypothetical protein